MTDSELATIAAVSDAPHPPRLARLHELTAGYHLTPLHTLRTAARLDRLGLLKSKEEKGVIRYQITEAGREALGE